jgi:hypothetical protein
MDLGFNTGDIPDDPSSGHNLVPIGWYTAEVFGWEAKTLDLPGGRVRLAEVTLRISDGPCEDRRLWEGFAVKSERPQDAEPKKWLDVSGQRIKTLARACGLEGMSNTDATLGKYIQIKVAIKPDKHGEPRNNVATFKPVGGWPATGTSRPAPAPGGAPAAAAPVSGGYAGDHDIPFAPVHT